MVTRTPPPRLPRRSQSLDPSWSDAYSWRRRLMISTISRCDRPPDGRIVTLAARPLRSSRAVMLRIDSTLTVITSSTRAEPAGPGRQVVEARPGRACGSWRRRSSRPGRSRSRRTSDSRPWSRTSRRARTGSIELRGRTTANCESPTRMPMIVRRDVEQRGVVGLAGEDAGVLRGAERDDLVGVRAFATACGRKMCSTIVRRPPATGSCRRPASTSSTSAAVMSASTERAAARRRRAGRAGPWSRSRTGLAAHRALEVDRRAVLHRWRGTAG